VAQLRSPQNTVLGFIGTGVMGTSMAGHLLAAGYPLHVFNRTPRKAQPLLERGAVWADSPKLIAQRCNCIITMIGYPKDVESVYLDDEGLIAHALPGAGAGVGVGVGALLIDMTTSRPDLARRIAAAAAARGLTALDAPVSGGDIGAREARLSIMVGGPRNGFEEALPVLSVMGKNVVYQGNPGAGQHTKMANQIAIAAGMIGVCEALAYAKAAGLDLQTVLRSISGGAAGSWTLSNLAPRMIAGDFSPGFYVKHFIKDLSIALESAEALGLQLPGLTLAKSLYEKLAAQGGADDGTQALYRLFVAGGAG
jgi:3-hydroxyisobutyrate dehydrogenase